MTDFHRIIEKGDLNEVKENYYKQNSIYFQTACESGHIDIAEWILELDPNIDIHNNNETFINVCKNGHIEIAKLLLKLDPNIDINDKDNRAFKCACQQGHLDIAKLLLTLDGDLVSKTKKSGLFGNVCSCGHLDMVKWLLTFDEININNIKLVDIFHRVCYNGKLDVAKFLWTLNNNIVNTIDIDVFDFICCAGHFETAKWLLEVNENIIYNEYYYFEQLIIDTNIAGHKNIVVWLLDLYKKKEKKDMQMIWGLILLHGIDYDEIFLFIDDKQLSKDGLERKYKLRNAITCIENFLFKHYYKPGGIHSKKVMNELK